MAGRGAQEKTYGELKAEWALDVVPTHHYGANSAWQQICVLGHNLLRNFQLQTVATPKPRSRKRTYCFLLQSLKTLRFKLIHQPARLLKPQGYSILRFSVAPSVQELIQTMEQKLKLAEHQVHHSLIVSVILKQLLTVAEKGRMWQAIIFEDDGFFHMLEYPTDPVAGR